MNTHKNSLNYFIWIPILSIISIIFGINITENYNNLGYGTSIDSYNYFKLAEDFPSIKDSIFPFLYPIFLKITNLLIHDYWLSSKLLNITLYIFGIYYTYNKKVFWKEYWIILSTVGFLENYGWSLSETLFIILLIILSQNLILYLNHKKNDHLYTKDILKFSILLCLIVTTKYSGLFIIFGLFIFCVIYYFNNKQILKSLLLSCLLAFIFFAFYLLLNFYQTGYTTGSRVSMQSMKETVNIRYSIMNLIYSLNPIINSRDFFGIKINYIVLALITSGLYFILIKISSKKTWHFNKIVGLHFTLAIVYVLGLFITFLNIKIDNLNPRLYLPFTLFIFISIFYLLNLKSNQLIILATACLSCRILSIIYLYL